MNEDGEAALKFLGEIATLVFDKSVEIIKFVFSLPIGLAKFILRLVASIPSLPSLIAKHYWRLYYRLFPNELRKKQETERKAKLEQERMEKANLLLEYEELLKKRDALKDKLIGDSELLGEFVDRIDEAVEKCGFEGRMLNKSPKQVLRSFDVRRLEYYDEIEKRAVELEQLTFRGFTVRQKLKLYGIDRGVEDNESKKV